MKQKKTLLYLLAGNGLLAFAVCAFVVPNSFIAGGSTGVALVVRSWLPIPLSQITAVVNFSLFLLGFACLGKKFAAASLCSTVIYPVILGLFERLPLGAWFSINLLLSAVLAGVFMGTGIGLVIRAGGSTGGMDIPPCILEKYKKIPVASSMFCFDLVILILQVLCGGAKGVLYGAVVVTLTSVMVNRTTSAKKRTPAESLNGFFAALPSLPKLRCLKLSRIDTRFPATRSAQISSKPWTR